MARTSSQEKLQERFYRPRRDGDWDYFPRGFAKPGFRVDDDLKKKLRAAQRATAQQTALLTTAVLLLAKFGGPEIARSYPSIAPYALSGIIRGAVALLVLMVLGFFVLRWDGGARKKLLENAPPAGRSFTAEEARQMSRELFNQGPMRTKIILGLFLIGLPGWMFYVADRKFMLRTNLGAIEGTIMILGAAMILALPVLALIRRMRRGRLSA